MPLAGISRLVFQIAIYFNALYSLVWCFIMAIMLLIKVNKQKCLHFSLHKHRDFSNTICHHSYHKILLNLQGRIPIWLKVPWCLPKIAAMLHTKPFLKINQQFKFQSQYLNEVQKLVTNSIVVASSLNEFGRLYLGFSGNLLNKVLFSSTKFKFHPIVF